MGVTAVYAELKAIAQGYMRSQRLSHTLQPTALVHEAWLKLFDREGLEVNDRHHFLALAARAMRQLLVGHARERARLRRGAGREAVTLDEAIGAAAGFEFDLIDLDAALHELAELDESLAKIVELRYFAGLDRPREWDRRSTTARICTRSA